MTQEQLDKLKEYIKTAVYTYTTGRTLSDKTLEEVETELDDLFVS